MLEHEYGGPLFGKREGDTPVSLISTHLRVLFQRALHNQRRLGGIPYLDAIRSRLPRRVRYRFVDERNSVGIALGAVNVTRVSALDIQLGTAIDKIGAETEFSFSASQIAHVCAADSMAALAFATSRSGYVREAGLSHIDGLGPTIGLSIVILRLNDWVPEVRTAAAKAAERLIANDGGPNGGLSSYIASSIGMLLDRERFKRMTQSEKYTVRRLLNYPGVYSSVRWSFVSQGPSVGTIENLRTALKVGYCDDLLPEIAQRARCAHRRLIAVRAILEGRYSWREQGATHSREISIGEYRNDVLLNALGDRSANVAFAALGYLIKCHDLSMLDRNSVGKLKKRKEVSLQKRIAIVCECFESSPNISDDSSD